MFSQMNKTPPANPLSISRNQGRLLLPTAISVALGQLLFSLLLMVIAWAFVTGPNSEAIKKAIVLCIIGPLLAYLVAAGPLTTAILSIISSRRKMGISLPRLFSIVLTGGLFGVAVGEAVAGIITVVLINTTHPTGSSLHYLIALAIILWFFLSTVTATIAIHSKFDGLTLTPSSTNEKEITSD
jgi:hypothetical protein